jgi:UDP:flavonoid glycosyltransferase YjiC (YdhE family)
LELKDSALPPAFSGYPTGDRAGWEEFREEYRSTHGDLWKDFAEFVAANGSPPLPELEFMPESPFLNLFLYPVEADYERSVPLGPTWHRLDSCSRRTESAFEPPESLGTSGALVYFSLGSLGSADVGLMRRLIGILAETPHRYVVSKGPQAELIELADNMWGEEFLPQPAILPRCDLVVTHGGNNTVTESLHHGKPMVVLPLFWDQYDNAQRMAELGFGRRLDPWTSEPGELAGAIDGLLADNAARERLATVAARVRSAPGERRAADLIERLARAGGS